MLLEDLDRKIIESGRLAPMTIDKFMTLGYDVMSVSIGFISVNLSYNNIQQRLTTLEGFPEGIDEILAKSDSTSLDVRRSKS
jgi:hypothetical protein